MPVTFGSVGDIIAVGLLIKDLVKCLDDSRGSSAEYQAVIRELWSLDHALLEIELLFLSNQGSKDLDALQDTALRIAEQCDSCIKGFREQVKKYKDSLQPESSGNFVKNAARKVVWNISEKEPLARFRAEIIAHCLSINVLIASAGVKSIRVSNENIQRGFKKVKMDQDQLSATQEALLADIRSSLVENRKEMQEAKSEVQIVGSGMDFMRNLGAELLFFMQKIWNINILTYKAIVTLQSRLPPQLERCWTQEPVTLRDPLGRVTPVHLEFIETWEAFQSMLEVRFRQLPGHGKVRRNEYALEANRSNQDIDSALAFRRWFRPGQDVDMSMVFDNSAGRTTSCPGCGIVATGPIDSKMKCQGCGMWHQRIEIEQEVNIQPQTPGMTGAKNTSGKRKRQEDSDGDDDPSQFCRVRLKCWKLHNPSLSGSGLKCPYCNAKFKSHEKLKNHLFVAHIRGNSNDTRNDDPLSDNEEADRSDVSDEDLPKWLRERPIRRESKDSDDYSEHRRALAEGAIAGVGAAELIRSQRNKAKRRDGKKIFTRPNLSDQVKGGSIDGSNEGIGKGDEHTKQQAPQETEPTDIEILNRESPSVVKFDNISGHSRIYRSNPIGRNESRVSNLAKHFEQLSREFELERRRAAQRRHDKRFEPDDGNLAAIEEYESEEDLFASNDSEINYSVDRVMPEYQRSEIFSRVSTFTPDSETLASSGDELQYNDNNIAIKRP